MTLFQGIFQAAEWKVPGVMRFPEFSFKSVQYTIAANWLIQGEEANISGNFDHINCRAAEQYIRNDNKGSALSMSKKKIPVGSAENKQ